MCSFPGTNSSNDLKLNFPKTLDKVCGVPRACFPTVWLGAPVGIHSHIPQLCEGASLSLLDLLSILQDKTVMFVLLREQETQQVSNFRWGRKISLGSKAKVNLRGQSFFKKNNVGHMMENDWLQGTHGKFLQVIVSLYIPLKGMETGAVMFR